MDYNIIIRPLVGGVIGYSTNWLAIKMLFRPYEEKRIGRFKIPFTPGVIPRERDRIAKSLGVAVGDQLLTEEVITEELLNDKVTDHIKSFVITDLLDREISLEDLLRSVLKEEADSLIAGFTKTIVTEIGMYLNNPVTRESVRSLVSDYMSEKVPYKGIIGDVVGDRAATEITGLVRENMDGITAYLSTFAKGEAVQARLGQAIETLVMEKVGALGAMFLDSRSMSASVADYIEGLLEEEEVREGIVGAVDGALEQLREENISDTVNLGLYQETVKGITAGVLDGIYSRISEERLVAVAAPMVKRIVSRKILLTDHQKAMIEGQVEKLYKEFVSKNITTFLETFEVSRIVESEINNFSVMEIEKLIFGIVDRELQAITWLGGLLGLIIGLVYAVI